MKRALILVSLLFVTLSMCSACGKAQTASNDGDAQVTASDMLTAETEADSATNKSNPAQQLKQAKALIASQDDLQAVDILRQLEESDEVNALLEQCRDRLLAPYEGKVHIDDEDEMADYYWIEPNDTSSYNNYLYISCSKANKANVSLCVWSMHVHNSSDGYISPGTLRIKGDGEEKVDIPLSYKDRTSDYANKKRYETANVVVSDADLADTLVSIVKDTESLTIRHNGTHLYGDNTVSASELKDMQRIAEYYEILCHLYK